MCLYCARIPREYQNNLLLHRERELQPISVLTSVIFFWLPDFSDYVYRKYAAARMTAFRCNYSITIHVMVSQRQCPQEVVYLDELTNAIPHKSIFPPVTIDFSAPKQKFR